MKKIKVFLVDDHAIVRDGISALLMVEDEIEIAGEASDEVSVDRILSHLVPDVIIMDIALPGISGIEISKKIKTSHSSVKILILSADGCEQNVFDALSAGVNGFLLKDTGKETLIRAIKTVFRGERFFDPSISLTVLNRLIDDQQNDKTPQKLSTRETEILKFISEGLSHKQVAALLFISKRTVDTHVNNIFQKLNIHNKAGLVKYAIKNNITSV